jgi:hypothetical protein
MSRVIACTCEDCDKVLMVRPTGIGAVFSAGWDVEWFMVKNSVWRAATARRLEDSPDSLATSRRARRLILFKGLPTTIYELEAPHLQSPDRR